MRMAYCLAKGLFLWWGTWVGIYDLFTNYCPLKNHRITATDVSAFASINHIETNPTMIS